MIGQFFNTVFAQPILNILLGLYKAFTLIHLPGAFGFSIVGLVVLVRLLLHPLFKQQLETAKKMQEIKPHLDHLSKKHSKDPKRLQQEQLKLYQQAGINPASGCLFMIIQIPVFFALYNTLSSFLLSKDMAKVLIKINKEIYLSFLKIEGKIDPWFFGFNLALSPAKAGQWYYFVIPVITAALQYWQAQLSMPAQSPQTSAVEEKRSDGKTAEVKKNDGDDFQKAMGMQMKYILPIMIGWFSYTLPVGLSLYWNIFSIFSIIQYRQMQVKSSPKV